MCVRAFAKVRENHCVALVRKKKVRFFFFFDSRHTQGDKLGVSLGVFKEHPTTLLVSLGSSFFFFW